MKICNKFLSNSLHSYHMQGVDLSQADYCGRTVLHMAALEGHVAVVRYILSKMPSTARIEDCFGRRAIDDAREFERTECVTLLEAVDAVDLVDQANGSK